MFTKENNNNNNDISPYRGNSITVSIQFLSLCVSFRKFEVDYINFLGI